MLRGPGHLLEVVGHLGQGRQQSARFVLGAALDPGRDVSLGQEIGGAHGAAERSGEDPGHVERSPDEHGEEQRDDGEDGRPGGSLGATSRLEARRHARLVALGVGLEGLADGVVLDSHLLEGVRQVVALAAVDHAARGVGGGLVVLAEGSLKSGDLAGIGHRVRLGGFQLPDEGVSQRVVLGEPLDAGGGDRVLHSPLARLQCLLEVAGQLQVRTVADLDETQALRRLVARQHDRQQHRQETHGRQPRQEEQLPLETQITQHVSPSRDLAVASLTEERRP